ncbi:hypothetical protein [Cryptosporangium minutisporangium]|uniref:HEAT repeat domain-containing protein n=1 Tax=Cryptosporangium minutisporangium TaxID=113569 RepID=A0ABP6TB76_9ACTN
MADTNTPADVLVALAEDASPNVRRALARRHPAPPEALRALVRDVDWKVRDALAENNGCPPDALLELIDDPRWSVRASVPFNPRADDRVRAAVLRSADETLRYLLVYARSLDSASRAVMAADPSPKVRGAVAQSTEDPDLLDALIDWVRLTVHDRTGALVTDGGPWETRPHLRDWRRDAKTLTWLSPTEVRTETYPSMTAEAWEVQASHTWL